MNVPLPPVFLAEGDYSEYVVVDGRQRITALVEYLKDDYPLEDLVVFPELNGKRFSELSGRLEVYKKGIIRRFLPAVIILAESDDLIKFDVFERLNTLGMLLSHMELRNSIYRGKLMKTMHELATNETFKTIWGIPTSQEEVNRHKVFTQMYDVELVLRFLAMRNYKEFKNNYKTFFNEFCANNKNPDARQLRSFKDDFVSTYETAYRLFEDRCIRKYIVSEKRWQRQPSAPLSDAVFQAIKIVSPKRLVDVDPRKAQEAYKALFSDKEFVKSINYATNAKSSIIYRIDAVRKALEQLV